MHLMLRIENTDRLENGGPISLLLDGREFTVGRRSTMDWMLPDPALHISGHHFTVRPDQGRYWLIDMSTNGTYLQGVPHRLSAPHPLQPGERILVGPYVIVVEDAAHSAPSAGAQPIPVPVEDEEDDPWGFSALGGVAPAVPNASPPAYQSNVAPPLDGFVAMPDPAPAPLPPQFVTDVPAPAPVDWPNLTPEEAPQDQLPAGANAIPPLPIPGGGADTGQPVLTSSAMPAEPRPFAPEAPPAREAEDGQGVAVLRAFCEGAGLDPENVSDVDPVALARMLGESSRVNADLVMAILRERSHMKQFTRAGERTMRNADGNNPLKFMQDTSSALEAMYLKPRDGFQTGADGFEAALRDIQQHQQAIFAALQPALAAVLEGLSPEEIEEQLPTGKLMPGSKRGRAWEAYVALWDARVARGDNGMLSVFLEAFARAYQQAHGDDENSAT
ncbi:type VI secretion system-associated FHA domain protein TagH [Tritonibacter scottomollicae]|nr:type VI secretion system-associated FHA domain protein TagH [Tritonibacter scottomollicae]